MMSSVTIGRVGWPINAHKPCQSRNKAGVTKASGRHVTAVGPAADAGGTTEIELPQSVSVTLSSV